MPADKTLKQLRLERGWTQEELAAASGVSVRTIQRIEQGGQAALESAKALAAAFDLPLAALNLAGKDATMTTAPAEPSAPTTGENVALFLCRHDKDRPPTERKRRFLHHLVTYALVIGGLTALNLAHTPEHLWVLWPAAIWGALLAHRGLNLWGLSRPRS